jgi:alpha-ribazole phosphatase
MTNWWWVRHGPTHAPGFCGWTDLPADLSDVAALKRLHRYLPQAALLVSSDLSRSIATADAIGDTRQRLPHKAALREFNFGDWEMQTYADVAEREPKISRAYWTNPGTIAPPGGESWNDVASRVGTAVDRLNQTHGGQDIIVVAHFGVILTQLQRAAALTPKSALSFRIDNLSVTHLIHLPETDAWMVGQVNHRP